MLTGELVAVAVRAVGGDRAEQPGQPGLAGRVSRSPVASTTAGGA